MNVKEESEKVWLKLNIQKTKIMASGPITSWEIDGDTVETVFWAPKSLQMVIAAMKLKDACLLLGSKETSPPRDEAGVPAGLPALPGHGPLPVVPPLSAL